MNDDEVIAFRVEHTGDLCVCGHPRAEHFNDTGASVDCRLRGCRCVAYAWDRP